MEKHLSRNLTWLLKQHQLTTAELSRRCGIAQPVMHRLVAGTIDNPQVNTLLPICHYFNCSLDTLIFEHLAESNETLSLTQTEIRHIMRNNLSVINSLIQGLEQALPIFAHSYLTLPKEFRMGNLSEEMISMMPNMLTHTIEAIAMLRESINRL